VVLAAGAGIFLAVRGRRAGAALESSPSVAVLPFRNLGAAGPQDYLGIAIPDEITTFLSYVPRLALRPFSQTSKYAGRAVDPQQAGRELQVSRILTGHYLTNGDRLEVTMEAIDVDENRLVWRDSISAASGDLIGLRSHIEARLHQGLMPRLGGGPSAAAAQASGQPRNSEAYDLFLRSIAVSGDPEPNRAAFAMLERATTLDPDFAPAWRALGLRYYYESVYGGGGTAYYEKSRAAFERSIALDPNDADAPSHLAIQRTEQGDLEGAYDDAQKLLRRRPDSGYSHHTMGYVYRYAGLLEESARECEQAIRIDPKSRQWRSCAIAFMALGRYDRAREFIALDGGSAWAQRLDLAILMNEGKRDELMRKLQAPPPSPMISVQWRLMRAYLDKRPETDIEASSADIEAEAPGVDGEPAYFVGETLAFCGRRDQALRLLRRALDHGFIPYPAMDHDPSFAAYRSDPSFRETRTRAIERQKKFLAYRDSHP